MGKELNINSRIHDLRYVILMILIILTYNIMYYRSSEEIEITVINKEILTTGIGENISSKFIIHTDDEVFENTSSWAYLKFSSEEMQNKLKIGNTYRVKVVGWRIRILTRHRNIVIIEAQKS